jgi:hypothetical protein
VVDGFFGAESSFYPRSSRMRALINVELSRNADGQFPTPGDIREILRKMGLQPSDMPDRDDPVNEATLRKYFEDRAKHILERIPEKSGEDADRKKRAVDNLVYASDLPNSNTEFMVTSHTSAFVRFRLLNPKLEDLQEGCEDLVQRIYEYNGRRSLLRLRHAEARKTPTLTIAGRIRILEHGLEEPTISGIIVRNRIAALWQFAAKDVVILVSGIILFLMLAFGPLAETTNREVKGHVDRFATAMLTAAVIAAIGVYHHGVKLRPLINWSLIYERSQ